MKLADERGVPVIVYAATTDVSGWLEDRLFPVYRYLRKFSNRRRRRRPAES